MDPFERETDDELLMQAAVGDGEAFAAFYRRHLAAVTAYLFRRVRTAELTADLTAETFAAALLSCRRFRPGEERALAWLLGIARNKLRESARRGRVEEQARQRLAMPVLALDDQDLLRVEELAAEGSRTLGMLDELPAAQREAVRARVIDERDYEEIAARMDCSEQVVRQHVSRGLKQLRATIGGEHD